MTDETPPVRQVSGNFEKFQVGTAECRTPLVPSTLADALPINQLRRLKDWGTRMAMPDELGIYSGAITVLEVACVARLYS
jgi:hypothetical protein